MGSEEEFKPIVLSLSFFSTPEVRISIYFFILVALIFHPNYNLISDYSPAQVGIYSGMNLLTHLPSELMYKTLSQTD